MIKPYYIDNDVTLYCGAMEKVLQEIDISAVDCVITDPPYPSYLVKEYKYFDGIINPLKEIRCRQFIFWTPSEIFPLDYSGMRIWDKVVGTQTQFEIIYERNYGSGYILHRFMNPHNTVRAQIAGDIYNGHPSQKPVHLIIALINAANAQMILDPFAGSGTTLYAAKLLKRKAIGIEISEKYCELIVNRLNKPMPLFDEQKPADLFVATT